MLVDARRMSMFFPFPRSDKISHRLRHNLNLSKSLAVLYEIYSIAGAVKVFSIHAAVQVGNFYAP